MMMICPPLVYLNKCTPSECPPVINSSSSCWVCVWDEPLVAVWNVVICFAAQSGISRPDEKVVVTVVRGLPAMEFDGHWEAVYKPTKLPYNQLYFCHSYQCIQWCALTVVIASLRNDWSLYEYMSACFHHRPSAGFAGICCCHGVWQCELFVGYSGWSSSNSQNPGLDSQTRKVYGRSFTCLTRMLTVSQEEL